MGEDIWSLGILLHVILTNTWPVRPGDIYQIRDDIVTGFLSFSETLSKNQLKFIKSLLCMNPESRPTIDDILNSYFLKPYAKSKNGDNIFVDQKAKSKSKSLKNRFLKLFHRNTYYF